MTTLDRDNVSPSTSSLSFGWYIDEGSEPQRTEDAHPAKPEPRDLLLDRDRLLTELFTLHHRKLHAFITRRIGDADEAGDIVQTAFLEAYRSLARFQGRSSLRTWLYGIALNVMRNHLSRRRDHVQLTSEESGGLDESDPVPSASDTYASRQELRRVLDALADVTPEQRDTLILVAVEGLSYEDAAQTLGVPVGTVRSRVSRLRTALRAARDGMDPLPLQS